MENWIKYLSTVLFLVIAKAYTFGQSNEVEMATAFRSEGKIYVVVAVALILLVGIFVMLFKLEKKVSALEKE